jgi:hypothetical protein
MKKVILFSVFGTVFLFTSCKETKKESKIAGIEISDSSNEGTFSIDGKNCNGKVSTQYFGSNKESDNFSVLCQQDEPFTLLQATFANQKDASSPNLKPKGGSYKVNEGEFDLSLTAADNQKEFIANEKSGGTVKVEGNKMTISNIKLFDADGKERVVNATINF